METNGKGSGKGTGARAPRRDAVATSRAVQALHLRTLGASYESIAASVGYGSKGAAFHAVQRELARTVTEEVEALRRLERRRLDELWRVVAVQAIQGNVRAVEACLHVMERRAKLLGLDALTQMEVTGTLNLHAFVAAVIQIFDEEMPDTPGVRDRIAARLVAVGSRMQGVVVEGAKRSNGHDEYDGHAG